MLDPHLEALRARYRPAAVRVLFLGESPPVGGTFFYAADSNLQRYTQLAFARVRGSDWVSGHDFLRDFAAWGCYLDDLCLDPVNGLDARARRQARHTAVPALAARIRATAPLALISVMTATAPQIHAAVAAAGAGHLPLAFMPFPTFGNQWRYVARLAAELEALRAQGIIG